VGDLATFAPWLIDAIVVLAVVEGLALAVYHRATGRGLAPRDYALHLLSGLALMLALRRSVGEGFDAVALAWLAAAGVLHAAELRRRWAQRRAATPR
jgi:hypothetical protein